METIGDRTLRARGIFMSPNLWSFIQHEDRRRIGASSCWWLLSDSYSTSHNCCRLSEISHGYIRHISFILLHNISPIKSLSTLINKAKQSCALACQFNRIERYVISESKYLQVSSKDFTGNHKVSIMCLP